MFQPPVQGRSASLRRGRISEDYACYSITKVVDQRRHVLAFPESARILTDSWNYLRSVQRIKLFAFCIMPDHLHVVFCLMPGEELSTVMEDTSKFTARTLNKLESRRGTFWQNGFHDHRCRNEEELHDICLYVEHNPVRARLVQVAEDWLYSSAHPKNRGMLDRDWWP